MNTLNFTVDEFRCPDSGLVLPNLSLLILLQALRTHFGKAVYIISGTRCAKHNKEVGGSPRSKHLLGEAADICVDGVKPIEVFTYLNESYGDILGLSCYTDRGFVHVDVRGYSARW